MRGFRVVWVAGGAVAKLATIVGSLREFASVRDAVLACAPALGLDDQYVVRGPVGGEWHVYRDERSAEAGNDGALIIGHDFGV